MSTTEKVHVATYEHKHGRDIRVFRSAAGADAWRGQIAADSWEIENYGKPKPSDTVELTSAYWESVSEREWFNVEEIDIED